MRKKKKKSVKKSKVDEAHVISGKPREKTHGPHHLISFPSN